MKIKNNDGFTLIHLMASVAIIAILITIALPLFNHYVEKSKAASGVGALGTLKNDVANCFLQQDGFEPCNSGTNGVHNESQRIDRINDVIVKQGVIEAELKATNHPQNQSMITIQLTPEAQPHESTLDWNLYCSDYAPSTGTHLIPTCEGELKEVSSGGEDNDDNNDNVESMGYCEAEGFRVEPYNYENELTDADITQFIQTMNDMQNTTVESDTTLEEEITVAELYGDYLGSPAEGLTVDTLADGEYAIYKKIIQKAQENDDQALLSAIDTIAQENNYDSRDDMVDQFDRISRAYAVYGMESSNEDMTLDEAIAQVGNIIEQGTERIENGEVPESQLEYFKEKIRGMKDTRCLLKTIGLDTDDDVESVIDNEDRLNDAFQQ